MFPGEGTDLSSQVLGAPRWTSPFPASLKGQSSAQKMQQKAVPWSLALLPRAQALHTAIHGCLYHCVGPFCSGGWLCPAGRAPEGTERGWSCSPACASGSAAAVWVPGRPGTHVGRGARAGSCLGTVSAKPSLAAVPRGGTQAGPRHLPIAVPWISEAARGRVAVPWLLLSQATRRGRWLGQRPGEGPAAAIGLRDVLVAAAPRGRGAESSWLSASLRGSTPHSPATFITQRAATCPAQTPAALGGQGAGPAEVSELLSLCSSCLSRKSLCGWPRGAHPGTRAEGRMEVEG